MIKLSFFATVLILVSCHNQVYSESNDTTHGIREKRFAHAAFITNAASAFLTVGEYAISFFDEEAFERNSLAEIDEVMVEFGQQLRHNFDVVIDNIIELPNYLAFLLQQRNFKTHLFRIHELFRATLRMRKQITPELYEKDRSAVRIYVEDFAKVTESSLEESMLEIRSIFADTDTTGFTVGNTETNVKKFLNVCRTKMSEMQILVYLQKLVLTAHGEYYKTKDYLSQLLEAYTQKSADTGEQSKKLFYDDVQSDYETIVMRIKSMMNTSSQVLFACDARDYTGDNCHENYSEYYVPQEFSPYIFEAKLSTSLQCDLYKKLERCIGELFSATKKCKTGFSQCKDFKDTYSSFPNQGEIAHLCVNDNATSSLRYHEVNLKGYPGDKFTCKAGKHFELKYRTDRYCDCLCHDKNYYYDSDIMFSDVSNNKVITGAQLVVDDKILHIRIQEAEISVNGTIIGEPVWRKRPQGHTKTESLLHLDSVGLTEIKDIPTSEVVVGLKLTKFRGLKGVRLLVITNDFNPKMGRLLAKKHQRPPSDKLEELKLEGQGIPTRAPKKNEPLHNNQLIKFSATGKLEDGTQTTIPFIDTQKVESYQPSPLSGAGLYLRGQPGYGGFLALKLYTYNALPFMPENRYFSDTLENDDPLIQL